MRFGVFVLAILLLSVKPSISYGTSCKERSAQAKPDRIIYGKVMAVKHLKDEHGAVQIPKEVYEVLPDGLTDSDENRVRVFQVQHAAAALVQIGNRYRFAAIKANDGSLGVGFCGNGSIEELRE